jgi:predicted lipoprotein
MTARANYSREKKNQLRGQDLMKPLQTLRITTSATLLVVGCLAISGCKIEHKSEAKAGQNAGAQGSFENSSFDPKKEVLAIWESKAIPTLKDMALDYKALKKEMSADLDKAGAKHGHREKGEGAPWNFVTTATGTIIETETGISAGTADLDIDGDGKADLQLRIGPVIRGTAIRDVLPFISFTSYTNQIDYAQLANAFNDQSFESSTLKAADRAALKGKRVEITGVFTEDSTAPLPLVTVTLFKVLTK